MSIENRLKELSKLGQIFLSIQMKNPLSNGHQFRIQLFMEQDDDDDKCFHGEGSSISGAILDLENHYLQKRQKVIKKLSRQLDLLEKLKSL